MTSAIVKAETAIQMVTPHQIVQQVQNIQQLMSAVMKDGCHYGTIKGCGDKPTLLQPGAQKLCLMFQLADSYEIEQTDHVNGHREYRVKCTLASKSTGAVQGTGVGICSTMESKYRYRTGPVEFTGKPVPREYWDSGRGQKVIGGKGFTAKKNPDTGMWEIAKQGEKVENPDIADTYNTVLKMACKRALVHATLNTTAASDIFAQDLEDVPQPQQQQQAAPPPDPFTAYREALATAKHERGVDVATAMAEVEKALGKKREEFTQADIAEACLIVEGMGAEEEIELEAEDIGF